MFVVLLGTVATSARGLDSHGETGGRMDGGPGHAWRLTGMIVWAYSVTTCCSHGLIRLVYCVLGCSYVV